MFIGHFAAALGAKKAAPKVKLGTLIFAAQFLDLIFPILTLAGLEHVRILAGTNPFLRLNLYDYPFSHSLLITLIWSLLIGGSYFLIHKQKLGAFIVGCAVLSHWILDLLTHIPDLPLAPGLNVLIGLGLWQSIIGTIIVESGLFMLGIFLYFRATKAKDTAGKYAPWTLILFLLFSYISSILSASPPDVTSFAIVGLIQWLFIPWGYWIDRHRSLRNE